MNQLVQQCSIKIGYEKSVVKNVIATFLAESTRELSQGHPIKCHIPGELRDEAAVKCQGVIWYGKQHKI